MAEFTLLLGGNLGEVEKTFARAMILIAERVGVVTAVSRDHVTEPWGFTDDRLFLNRAVQVESALPPSQVMERLLRIEQELGRTRTAGAGYGSRGIDIDILFIESQIVDLPELTVPHPRVQQRLFALAPTADIAPFLVHPVLGTTVMEMLNNALR